MLNLKKSFFAIVSFLVAFTNVEAGTLNFECEIKNYPNIYEDELIKGSMIDADIMYRFSDAIKEDENKNVVEPGFNCRRVGFFCSKVTNVY